MSIFIRNIDELLYLTAQKKNLTNNLTKNYRENINYIIKKDDMKNNTKHGGHNKIAFFLTEETFELLKNSFNLRNRYIADISNNVKQINIGMCIENQTIGFIENAYNNMLNIKRQYTIGKYRTDLYFIDYKLAIECDENDHCDRDKVQEKIREDYIISFGNKIIRFNPNTNSFDLSNVLRKINAILFSVKL